jgi:hypothetical protein
MGRSMQWLMAAGAVLVSATGALARPVLSYSLPDPLNFREQREWGALAACPAEGPCDVGYTIDIDAKDGRRERRLTSRQDLFNGEYDILLVPRAPSLDTHHAFLQPDTLAGQGAVGDYRDIPAVVATTPSVVGTTPRGRGVQPAGSGGGTASADANVSAVDPPNPVPEPVTLTLTGVGLAALALKRRALRRA